MRMMDAFSSIQSGGLCSLSSCLFSSSTSPSAFLSDSLFRSLDAASDPQLTDMLSPPMSPFPVEKSTAKQNLMPPLFSSPSAACTSAACLPPIGSQIPCALHRSSSVCSKENHTARCSGGDVRG